MITKRLLAVVGSVLLLLTAACGDDTSSDDGAASREARSATYDDDLAVAQAALLTLDDLPVGWSSTPREEEDDTDEFDQQLAGCLGVPVEEIADSSDPQAESETFVGPDESEIEAEIIIAPTVAEATEGFEEATSTEFLECLREVLPDLMESAAAEGGDDVTFAEASIGPLQIEDAGDRSAAFRMSVTVQVETIAVDVYFDIQIAQIGRATIQVSTMSIFSTPDVEFGHSLLEVMLDRIDAAAVS